MRHTKKQTPKANNEPTNANIKTPKKCTCGAGQLPKPKLPANMRRLKIQPKYLFSYKMSKTVPFLVLQGQWLQQMGFECEQYVMVSTKVGELIIRVVHE